MRSMHASQVAHKLSIRHLSKCFRDLEVLSDISVDVSEGEFVGIVGPSGCGKTTFLRIVDGLESADDGEIRIDGRVTTKPGPDRAFVFQNDSLFPWRNVWRNATMGLEIQGRLRSHTRERVRGLLELVGLGGFERFYPRQLSGGMRQRLNLARALAVNPEVLLMDEPFAALDAQTREIMQTELLRIWEATRATVLFITHQIDEAVYLSDRVLVFSRRPGKIQEDIRIELPRPREFKIKRSAEFTAYVARIWTLIENAVRESVMEDRLVSSSSERPESGT
jgi:NitT/TauT family transport system ATP-binding protein